MNRRRALGVAIGLAVVLSTAPIARAALSMERLRDYVQRTGARIESAEGNLLVTSLSSGGPKVEIRLLNDSSRHRIGLYAYGFGNATGAPSTEALLDYLLLANSELGTGGFFVDKDRDIGYKLLLDTRDTLSAQTFQIKYLAMVAVIRERRPEILKLVGKGPSRDKPTDEAPADSEEPVPQQELTEAPAQTPPRFQRQ